MCRYDDEDCEWYVESEHSDTVADVDRRCEDCGRAILAGEPHVRFVAVENPDSEFSDREYVFVAQQPIDGFHHDFDADDPYVRIAEDDCDRYQALGYIVDEVADPDYQAKIDEHYSCAQCRLASDWLTKVCDQHVVLVTREDLAGHTDEYDAATLGPHFMALTSMCDRGWLYKRSLRPVPPAVVSRATRRAVAHAERAGLVES